MLKRDFLFTECRQNVKTKNVVFLAVNPLELFCFIFDYFFAVNNFFNEKYTIQIWKNISHLFIYCG